MSTVLTIFPYKDEGLWVFDDPAVGLVKEPFVLGADAIIERLVENIPYASLGFTLHFSGNTFAGTELELEWQREEDGGNWYKCLNGPAAGMEGWLCPALFHYFKATPPRLFAQFVATSASVTTRD